MANTEQVRRLGFLRSVFDLLKDAELARANDLLDGRLKWLNRKRKLAEGAKSSALTVNLLPIIYKAAFFREVEGRGVTIRNLVHASHRKKKRWSSYMADSTIRAEPASIFSNKSRHVAALLPNFVYV